MTMRGPFANEPSLDFSLEENRAAMKAALRRVEGQLGQHNPLSIRECTGAMMEVHPFARIKLSGTDSKAGGPDYLLTFVEAEAIGERL